MENPWPAGGFYEALLAAAEPFDFAEFDEAFLARMEAQRVPDKLLATIAAGDDVDAVKAWLADMGQTPRAMICIPLHAAIDSRRPKVVELLLKQGAGTGDTGYTGPALNSALTQARPCDDTLIEIIRLLLEGGADPHPIVVTGSPPHRYPLLHVCTELFRATGQQRAAVVKLLMKHGASVFRGELFGNTALAETYSSSEAAKAQDVILENLPADLNTVRNDSGRTLLFYAHDWREAELLVDHGLDLHARDNMGQQAIHSVVQRGKSDSLEFLLEEGVSPNVADDSGVTPLDLALKVYENQARLECLICLLEYGVNLRTPEDRAAVIAAIDSCSAEADIPEPSLRDGCGRLVPHRRFWRLALEAPRFLEAYKAKVSSDVVIHVNRGAGWEPDDSRDEFREDAWQRRGPLICAFAERRRRLKEASEAAAKKEKP